MALRQQPFLCYRKETTADELLHDLRGDKGCDDDSGGRRVKTAASTMATTKMRGAWA
jgi:hypothetical protein